MKKFEGILICTDLDGTLLRKDKTVSKENFEAIEYFKSEGGMFTFITGRMPYTSGSILNMIRPNVPFGCINGGGIYDPEKDDYVWNVELKADAIDLVEYADERIPGLGIQINMFDKIYFSRENSAMEAFRKSTGSPNLVAHYRDIKEPIAKVVFGDEREGVIQELQSLLFAHPRADEFDFIRSELRLYEILPKGISKGTVLKKLAEHLGVDMKKTIAVGDYNNDISMIRAAGIGIAVANANDDVKAYADHVTVDHEQHALARIIADIEEGNLRFSE